MRKYILILFSLLVTLMLPAQVVYECDFEDSEERAQWVLNSGSNQALINRLENKWYIGAAANRGETGENGLFISNNGVTSTYTNNSSAIVYAYRAITLEPGTYTISFDWVCNSASISGEGFYPVVVSATDQTVKINSAAQVVPGWVSDHALTDPKVLGGVTTWQLGKGTFTVDGTEPAMYYIIFAWYQNSTRNSPAPSAMIDNIRISTGALCPEPTQIKFTVTNGGLNMTWRGSADYYEVKVYDYKDNVWQTYDHITAKKLLIENLNEGISDVYIRAHCGAETSDYVLNKPFFYLKGNRCIEYMSLDDQNLCRCYTGDYTNQRQNIKRVEMADLMHGEWYYSAQGAEPPLFSLHFMPDEFDPNTDYQLRTKPKGAVASVRLGRFDPTFGACTEYTYTVPDGDHSILMLRYAVVLPNPHPESDPPANPKFNIDVLANGQPIHDGCGKASFISALGDAASWNQTTVLSQSVLWKDWTEIAINLREYVGQKITVRLMTTGCSPGAHGGYAYYTLECEEGTLTGINCGDIPTTQFVAPSGFDYEWYKSDDPGTILGTERIFNVAPNDTFWYNVDVISKTNDKCYYTLDATAIPRFPVAVATYEKVDNPCENTVVFHQTCHIKYKNQITEREWHTDLPVETILWDFGDGTQQLATLNEYVTHTYPRDGGHYTASITAGIVDDICQTTYTIPLDFPPVGKPPRIIHADVCEGDCYQYNGVYYCNTYKDTLYYQSAFGCDSIVIFDIIMHNRDHTARAGLCEGEAYDFGGEKLYEPGVYTHTFTSSVGCDSVVTLTLDVEPRLIVNVPETVYICQGDNDFIVDYEYVQGNLDSVIVRLDKNAVSLGFDSVYIYHPGDEMEIVIPDSVPPTRIIADVELATPFCPVPHKKVVLEMRYKSSVIHQNNGIIALMNEHYNGGYQFTTYQWFRDGQPISGATSSFLAATDGDVGHTYSVVVTREGWNEPLATCEIVYTGLTAVNNVTIGQGPVRVYNILGVYLGQLNEWDEIWTLPAGIYVIIDGENEYKIVR